MELKFCIDQNFPQFSKYFLLLKKKIAKKIEKIIERIGIKKYITINHNII